ncbi:MAG: alkaline phosphatase family protein [Candidatus Omnitrophota bacterium]|jgi:predicted AlkP superfamily phosphohydrolase/phosphomutase
MMVLKKKGVIFIPLLAAAVIWLCGVSSASEGSAVTVQKSTKIYWFIPDGLRADPDVFKIFDWAREGKLPNLKKLMDNGSYGYSIPVFPTHTPVNFATLFTGSYPRTHGVADGPMHVEGRPLDKVAIGGFSSVAKKVPPIWVTMEKENKKVFLLSLPGSTPPELDQGTTIRGRWSGWGADFHPLVFQSNNANARRSKQGRSARLFFFGPDLTRYFDLKEASGWENMPVSKSQPLESEVEGWGQKIVLYIYDTTDDNTINYDRIIFSPDKKSIFADLSQGKWSDWLPAQLKWQKENVDSNVKIKIIKLNVGNDLASGDVRIRCFYNNLNRFVAQPPSAADEINKAVGPMVDFADNFPAQLVYVPEDKETFREEADMSLDWHKKAAGFIIRQYKPDVFIQDTYTPGQMLSSRWWMGAVDPESIQYASFSAAEREERWDDVLSMYKKVDEVLGEYLKNADENTLIVFSSDHGMAALNREVQLNNLFAKEGLLKFTIDEKTGEPVIDWKNSKVIYLKMCHVYIHPDGLAGEWKRASGPKYEKLRARVIKMLKALKDKDGKKPLAAVVKGEDAPKVLKLPTDRVGDLVIANNPGFFWDEEMGNDLTVFADARETGYKQSILPEAAKAIWTPFVVMGPGVKKNYAIEKPISMTDEYPTIMHLMGVAIPSFVEGQEVKEIYEHDR